MRCCNLSKSMRTGLGGALGAATAPAPQRPPRPPPAVSAAALPSSSLSGAMGEGTLQGSTARYRLQFTSNRSLVISRQLDDGPEMVLAVKQRYCPARLN